MSIAATWRTDSTSSESYRWDFKRIAWLLVDAHTLLCLKASVKENKELIGMYQQLREESTAEIQHLQDEIK